MNGGQNVSAEEQFISIKVVTSWEIFRICKDFRYHLGIWNHQQTVE